MNSSFARQLRVRRLYSHGDERLLVVPLDHSVSDGPVTGGRRVNHLVGQLASNGVDAVVLHKGALRYIDHRWFTQMSLIVHLSASTVRAPDPDEKYLVATVEESLRMGADAVSVHVNLGSRQEMRQIADLAAVSNACDRWNVPLLAMMYARGPEVRNPRDPELVAHGCSLAADMGADIVKSVYVGSVAEMAEITATCPIPVVVAGGPRLDTTSAVVEMVDDALMAGAAGVAMGRNVFQSSDPAATVREVCKVIHRDPARELHELDRAAAFAFQV